MEYAGCPTKHELVNSVNCLLPYTVLDIKNFDHRKRDTTVGEKNSLFFQILLKKIFN